MMYLTAVVTGAGFTTGALIVLAVARVLGLHVGLCG